MRQDQFKVKREEFATELRRKNREEIFQKKRNIDDDGNQNEESLKRNKKWHIIDQRFAQQITQFQNKKFAEENLLELLQAIHDPDPIKQHYGAIGIRILLCQKRNPPIQKIIDAGIVPKLLEFAKQAQYPQLQLEATWSMTNIAAGNSIQCSSIIDKGGIKIFIDLLTSEHIGIVQQSIWALGNIACDIPTYRDSIIKNGGLSNLVKVIQILHPMLNENPGFDKIIQSAAWALSNLARSQPHAQYRDIKDALPTFFFVIKNNLIKDIEIVANICWAISYYTNKRKENFKVDKLQNCINSGIVPNLIQFIKMDNNSLVVASTRILGSIASGTQSQTAYIIEMGILDLMEPILLRKKKKALRRQACWLLSNITGSSRKCIQAALSRNQIVEYVLKMFQSDLPEIKTEICYFLANATEFGNRQELYAFYKRIDVIKYYAEIIRSDTDALLIETTLQTLFYILQLGEHFKGQELQIKCKNYFVYCLYKQNVVAKLQDLQMHEEQKIYEGAARLLSTFFTLIDPLSVI